MEPRTFMRGLEEQLRRVKSQYIQLQDSLKNSDLDSVELLRNAKLWFLRTVENTELQYYDMRITAVEYLGDEVFDLQKSPPHDLRYPTILWMISTMPQEQVEAIFGVQFYARLVQNMGQITLNDRKRRQLE